MIKFRYIILLIGILAIGVVVIPSIYSIFGGQHSFYEGSCIKCHSDIRKELDSSVYHKALTCEACHVDPSLNGSGTHGNVIIPTCLTCHGDVISSLNVDSHQPMILHAIESPLMKAEDEACIACHTTRPLDMTMTYTDTFIFDATRLNGNNGWQISNYRESGNNSVNIKANGTGQHNFPSLTEFSCEKCHTIEIGQLSNSRHNVMACETCHQITGSEFHAANIPSCINCHLYQNNSGDAHIQFVNFIGGRKNLACSSCHSTFNKDITFVRPSYIQYDVVGTNTSWTIENLLIGPTKNVPVTINLDGKLHNISTVNGGNCILCHKDIRDAVISGGHSNEKWKNSHNYISYSDMNLYCRYCHMPDVLSHSGIKTNCIDCHQMEGMKGIEISMAQQPYFVQSYLCIACKNAGNPDPGNSTLHFRVLTEPEITIYINDVQKYP